MNPELKHYLDLIDDLRQQVIELIAELPAEALNWRPLDGDDHATNSLAVMAAHVAGAEHFWIAEAVGGYPATRDRPAEFSTAVAGPDPLVERLRAVGAETRAVLSALTAEQLAGEVTVRGQREGKVVDDKIVSVRWGILHVIDHTALHLGHMQITYQLWMGGQAKQMPRWFERVKSQGRQAGELGETIS